MKTLESWRFGTTSVTSVASGQNGFHIPPNIWSSSSSLTISFNQVQSSPIGFFTKARHIERFLVFSSSFYIYKKKACGRCYVCTLYREGSIEKSWERETHSTDVVLFPFPTNYLQTPPRLCVKTASGPTSSFSFYQPNYNQIHTHTQKVN